MKRDHFDSKPPRRPSALAAAALVAGLCGLVGVRLGLGTHDTSRVADPMVQPTFHESVFPNGRRPSAVPDHALLSKSDVDRALPVPDHRYGYQEPAAS